MSKHKTNEQNFRALLKDLHTVEVALLAERMLHISDLTRKAIAKDPESFCTPFTNPQTYLKLCDKIDAHLSDKQPTRLVIPKNSEMKVINVERNKII